MVDGYDIALIVVVFGGGFIAGVFSALMIVGGIEDNDK